MRQKSPPAPSRKPALDGSWLNFAKLNASEANETEGLVFSKSYAQKPDRDGVWFALAWLNIGTANETILWSAQIPCSKTGPGWGMGCFDVAE